MSFVHSSGYPLLHDPSHHRSGLSCGNVFEHIVIVERAIGRPLPVKARVHHINEVLTDNRNCNLVVLENQAEHNALHYRLKVLRAGGNPWTQRLCSGCLKIKGSSEFGLHLRSRRPGGPWLSPRCRTCECLRAQEDRGASWDVGSARFAGCQKRWWVAGQSVTYAIHQ